MFDVLQTFESLFCHHKWQMLSLNAVLQKHFGNKFYHTLGLGKYVVPVANLEV